MINLQNKNILFVGDLRTAYNYGAIATTETLLAFIESRVSMKSLNVIDHRSFSRQTPQSGWPAYQYPSNAHKSITFRKYFTRSASHLLDVVGAKKLVKNLLFPNDSSNNKIDHVPWFASQYDEYAEKILKGELFPYEKKLLEESDIVLINGEGNIVNGIGSDGKSRSGARYILFMAYVAKKYFKKKVAIINHVVDPDTIELTDMIKKVYPLLDHIIVRDPLSLEKLDTFGLNGIAHFNADALFLYEPQKDWLPEEKLKDMIDFSKPYICLGDSSGLWSQHSVVKWDIDKVFKEMYDLLRERVCEQIIYIDGFNGLHEGVNKFVSQNNISCLNLCNCDYKTLIEVIGRAGLFISGRWHASIMGAISGTPFLLWSSDSHKTRAMNVIYDYPHPFFNVNTLPIHLENMVSEAEKIWGYQDQLRDKIKSRSLELRQSASNMLEFLKNYE